MAVPVVVVVFTGVLAQEVVIVLTDVVGVQVGHLSPQVQHSPRISARDGNRHDGAEVPLFREIS